MEEFDVTGEIIIPPGLTEAQQIEILRAEVNRLKAALHRHGGALRGLDQRLDRLDEIASKGEEAIIVFREVERRFIMQEKIFSWALGFLTLGVASALTYFVSKALK